MGRLGAIVWTGDVDAKWEWLLHTPGTMLNWVLAGAAMVSCDSGGPWHVPYHVKRLGARFHRPVHGRPAHPLAPAPRHLSATLLRAGA